MNQLILSIKKRFLIPLVSAIGVLVWLGLCQAHHESYWQGTIYRVQTVDFNLLHHTLPATLSQLIIAGQEELIQETLDSTYGLFGLVITDPSGQSVLYKTSRSYHRQSWQPLITARYLAQLDEPYDLLTDPAPSGAQFQHQGPRSAHASPTGNKSSARVLGRIYYVRSPAPAFLDDLVSFFATGMVEVSGAKRGYLFITCTILGFSAAIILLILWRQRGLALKQRELEIIAKDMEARRRALDHLTEELMSQKARKDWLETEATQAYKRALKLKEAFQNLRGLLTTPEPVQQQGKFSVRSDGNQEALNALQLRPAVHPPSAVIEEIEALLPGLTTNAESLKSQAAQLHSYCSQLEKKQTDLKDILEQRLGEASNRAANGMQNVLHFKQK